MSTAPTGGTVIVAGGGVVRDGVVEELRALVDRTNVGVLNTWAAKGLFPWDSPAHLGTIGLQERDLELAGLARFDEVVVIGVDRGELPRDRLDALGVRRREIATGDLRSLELPPQDEPTPRPALYTELAAACGPLYDADTVPMNPARAASDLAAWLPDGGMVAADAGRAGFWLGRTFPTRRLGSMVLPTVRSPGFAATQALIAARLGRAAVVVVDELDPATEAVLGRAGEAVAALVVEVWTGSGPALGSAERLAHLDAARAAGGVRVLELALAFERVADLEAVAGSVTAWC